MKTQIEKKLPAKGDRMEETEKLIKIASESLQEEKDMSDFMDMKYEEALKKFLKNNPGKTEQDFIDEAIIRIPMESGGKILDFAKYAKTFENFGKKVSKNMIECFNVHLSQKFKRKKSKTIRTIKTM